MFEIFHQFLSSRRLADGTVSCCGTRSHDGNPLIPLSRFVSGTYFQKTESKLGSLTGLSSIVSITISSTINEASPAAPRAPAPQTVLDAQYYRPPAPLAAHRPSRRDTLPPRTGQQPAAPANGTRRGTSHWHSSSGKFSRTVAVSNACTRR